ncbi:MAG TPA: alpha/beta hydrolase family protein [Acidimicrobiales bacterium]|nr:alpha/beta hydrolase family protein [Acidimicrobiales bacterium]
MSATPLWFGPEEAPLFGWFHAPEGGRARCAAVLCPAIGFEGAGAHYTFRKLAEGLADTGVAVLRFDYNGTGDSSGGAHDPDRVALWRASVRHALEAMRSSAALPIVMVGIRMGATFAMLEACEDGDIDGLVLWDPCVRGRSFLRQQTALMRFVAEVEPRDDGAVETMGLTYDAPTASDIAEIDIAEPGSSPARSVLVLWRPDRRRDPRFEARLRGEVEARAEKGSTGPEIIWDVAEGQDALAARGEVPNEALACIIDWFRRFGALEAGEWASVSTPAGASSTVVKAPDNTSVHESAVFLGPTGLFGVLSEPATSLANGPFEGQDGSPTVMFFNFGINHREGPGRMWVDLSRAWSARGMRCLRVDRSGIGDSPVRPGQEERITYPPEAVEDARDLAEAVSPGDPRNVVLVGVCAGAYLSVESGISLSARGVCAVNPVLTFTPWEHWTGQTDPGRQAVRSKRWWMKTAASSKPFIQAAKPYIPWRVWWLLHVLGVQSSPGSGFEPLVEQDVDTLVICDKRDSGPYVQRSPWVLRKLAATGKFRFESYGGNDHLLLTEDFRNYVADMLTEHVLARFAPLNGQRSLPESQQALT